MDLLKLLRHERWIDVLAVIAAALIFFVPETFPYVVGVMVACTSGLFVALWLVTLGERDVEE